MTNGSVFMSKPNLNSLQDEKYAEVNAALNDYFFSGRFEMQPVYLDLEDEAESELTRALGVEQDELKNFIGSCVARSLRIDRGDPYINQENWLKGWSKTDRRTPPPFTALLCALSIAAERMGADNSFSDSNYYKRLFELFGVKDSTSQTKFRTYAKRTEIFWKALNSWLIENDSMLGISTAQSLMRGWKYASYALSQALVRDADRKRFTSLFEIHNFLPGDSVSETYMNLCIDEWMSIDGPTGPTMQLRRLWAIDDIRERVAVAAIDALETWKASPDIYLERSRNAKFRWLLSFISFPRKQASLSLAVTRGGQEEFLQASTVSAQEETELFLERWSDTDIYILGPNKSIDLGILLLQPKEFTGEKSGNFYKYEEKPIVPLKRSSDGPFYEEVFRASLFEEHAILCHGNWLEKVEKHLSNCAHPDYEVLAPSDMRGIPESWYILRKVEIFRADENASDNLHVLNPIGSSIDIKCSNGLKLDTHRTWHTDARPTLKSTTGMLDCTIKIVREQFDEMKEDLVSSNIFNDFTEIGLDSLDLSPRTDLRATITKGKITRETSFSLRSADIPRPLFGKKRIFHPFMEDEQLSFEASHIDSGSQNGLEGCFIHGDFGKLNVKTGIDLINYEQKEIPEGSHEISPEIEWKSSPDGTQKIRESCIIRGIHEWVVPPYKKGDNRFEIKIIECKHCSARYLRSSKEARKINKQMWQGGRPVRRVQAKKEEMVETNQSKADFNSNSDDLISPDTIYDGLCYLGRGTWRDFQRIASRASQDPWFPSSFANDLFSLGHLEAQNAFHSTMSDWSVPPPVLVVKRNNQGYLAGFHSKTLLERIDAALIQNGAQHEFISAPEQVTVHQWTDIAGIDIETQLKGIKDPYDRPVTAVRDLDVIIANKLPTLDKIWECGQPMHVEKLNNLAKFDVHQVKWVRMNTLQGPGAYRVGLHGTRYIYRDTNDTTRQVGYRAAKILAARAENIQLHKYDPVTNQFTATLGVDPPSLFARALVVSSGTLPKVDNGRLIYADVDPVVATLVLNKMYGREVILG